MKLALTGGYGQLGSEIRRTAAAAGHEVFAPTSSAVDLCDSAAVQRWVQATQADAWINAAAYTAVDAAEDDANKARAVNTSGARNLAEALLAAESTAPLLYLSTDYVFDGEKGAPYTEQDATNPQCVYGATKLAGEVASLLYPQALVLRVSWVFGVHGHNFVKSILRAARRFAREGGSLKVVDDQHGAPCSTKAITQTLLALIATDAPAGIYHMTSSPHTNWHGFATAIVEEAVAAGLLSNPVPVLTQPTSALNQQARRPADGRMNADKLHAALQTPAPQWRDDLRAMLNELDEAQLDAN